MTPEELDAPLDELEELELDELEDVELPEDDDECTDAGSWKMPLLEPPQPANRLARIPALNTLLIDIASP